MRFVNLNIAAFDAAKQAGVALVADARAGDRGAGQALAGWSVGTTTADEARRLAGTWDAMVERAYPCATAATPAQSEVIGAVNDRQPAARRLVCAAGSMPGDLHKLWRTRDPKGYHVEYGYSTMGYEIAGGLGVRMAAPDREVFVLVGDGSYLMLAQELVTAVAEHQKLIVVLVQNHGYRVHRRALRIGGSQRFGTRYRYRDPGDRPAGRSAAPGGPRRERSQPRSPRGAGGHDRPAVHGAGGGPRRHRGAAGRHPHRVDPLVPAPSSEAWWDVPVAETSTLDTVRDARAAYDRAKTRQRPLL